MKIATPLLAVLLTIIIFIPKASAIPSFSRQASLSCKACHSQHVPILNGFGQAFKAAGYPIMGTQGTVESDGLSIPDTLNASMVMKARYQKSNGAGADLIPGDTTNSGQWLVPEEFSLYFGGRIAQTIGFFFEGNTSGNRLITGFKLPAAIYIAEAKFSVIPFMTDFQGASFGYEQSSTGAAHNVTWSEHRMEISAQQYIGSDTAASGVAIVAQNDNGYINLSRWAPAFTARKGAAQTLASSYLRIVATPTLQMPNGDWSIQLGTQVWRGTNYAIDTLGSTGLVPVETRAIALDIQAYGLLDGKELGVYVTWARSPAGSAAKPNILNVGRSSSGILEPTLYRLNERKAWTIGAEYSVIPDTLHIGAAYRRANTGGSDNNPSPAIVGDNPSDNAITLTGVYNISQNIEFHLNHSFYSGSLYDTPQPNGDQLTTFMLQAAW